MKSTDNRDPVATEWGKRTEKAVRQTYLKLGYGVIPLYAIEDGGAPMLISDTSKWRLPDMILAGGGRQEWVEVKFKDHPAKFQKVGRWRHGIDIPKWKDYCKIEKETGQPGALVILQYRFGPCQQPEPYLLKQSFAHLSHVVQFNEANDMVYWDVHEMDTVCALDFDATDIPRLTEKIHIWEEVSRMGKAPGVDLNQQQRSFPLFGSEKY